MMNFLKLLVLGVALPAALFAEGVQGVAPSACDGTEQTAIIASALKSYYSIDGALDLTAVKTLASLDKTPTSVELLEVPENISSLMPVKARYMNGAEKLGEISATFKAQWRVSVLVPRRQLARGVAVSKTDFETQTVDRLALKQVPVDTTLELAGYEMENPLSAGVPLTWNCLKAQPLVRKGAMADVIAQEGNLRVTTRAVALRDAGRGEQVIMRNPSTNHQFEAYVVNENLVQIRF